MKNKSRRLLIALALGLGLTLALLWLLGHGLPARAAPTADLTVCPAGPPTCDYASVQAAVDAAGPGDVIKVAASTYTDLSVRPRNDIITTGVVTQVVYISKTLTIRGGYTTANWTTPDPAANPTTLDAQGLGRVLYITGDISPTVEGLRITGGDATGLGGDPWGRDGGGAYVYEAAATISDCAVISNTASTTDRGSGGGLFLGYSPATLSGNTVQGNTASTADRGSGGGLCLRGGDAILSGNSVVSNTASTASKGYGGGLCLRFSRATLSGNTVVSNTASTASYGHGGGLFLRYSPAVLSGNTVQGNTASRAYYGYGGGLYLEQGSDATLSGNTVQGNTAGTASGGSGGGLYLGNSDATLRGNTVISNAASTASWGYGGGLYLYRSDATLINNVVADNQANTQGSGLYFKGSSTDPTSSCLLHTTLADNRGSGQGVFMSDYTTLALTNTIIAGHHSVGITVTTGSTATLEATLWYGNGLDTGGGGTIVTGTVNVYDDPAFVDPSAWDYHLTAGSAAIDKGVNAGVDEDIDGDLRPIGVGYDIGADEYIVHIYLPIVLRNYAP